MVLCVWLGAFIDGSRLLAPHGLARLAFTVLMLALILGICCLKGEPLKWRGGRAGP